MNDPRSVRCVQGPGHSAQNGHGFDGIQATPRLQVLLERGAVQELHHVILTAVRERSEAKDVDDVLVPNLIGRTRLGNEARHHFRIRRQPPREHLDGDRFTNQRLNCVVNAAKAAGSDLLFDLVVADHFAGPEIAIHARDHGIGNQRRPIGRALLDLVGVLRHALGAGGHFP